MSPNDLNKTLQEFGVKGEFIGDVKVFMYVMHPKKANVPKEEFEGVRSKQLLQRKQQQGQASPGGCGRPEWACGCGECGKGGHVD